MNSSMMLDNRLVGSRELETAALNSAETFVSCLPQVAVVNQALKLLVLKHLPPFLVCEGFHRRLRRLFRRNSAQYVIGMFTLGLRLCSIT